MSESIEIFKVKCVDTALVGENEIIKVLKVDSYRELERRLHKRFKDSRIPQTEYFRLN